LLATHQSDFDTLTLLTLAKTLTFARLLNLRSRQGRT